MARSTEAQTSDIQPWRSASSSQTHCLGPSTKGPDGADFEEGSGSLVVHSLAEVRQCSGEIELRLHFFALGSYLLSTRRGSSGRRSLIHVTHRVCGSIKCGFCFVDVAGNESVVAALNEQLLINE